MSNSIFRYDVCKIFVLKRQLQRKYLMGPIQDSDVGFRYTGVADVVMTVLRRVHYYARKALSGLGAFLG